MTDHVDAGGVTVSTSGDQIEQAAAEARSGMAGVAAGIVAKDADLWGPDARDEAAKRLGWIDAPGVSRPLLQRIGELREGLRGQGVTHVVLAGMGGSSLAPEVITQTYGVELTVLDTTDPGQIAPALDGPLDSTVLVVSSKSGGTLETDSHRRAFEQAFRDAGIDPADRIVVVTDPGSPLQKIAEDAGYQVFLADPDVGGRYSALTAFGLVPSGLAGAPVPELLDQAAEVLPALGGDEDNPGLTLGVALGGFGVAGHDKVVLAGNGAGGTTPIVGFGDWAEQLIAESTGKQGRGLLPVVVDDVHSPGFAPTADVHQVTLGGDAPDEGSTVDGSLGAQFMVWEYAIAVAGRAIGIDPFDQPNVQESKDNTNKVLDQAGDGPLPVGDPAYTDGSVEVHADTSLLGGADDLAGALDALLAAVPDRGYLAVMAYLDRWADSSAADLRDALAERLAHPVTFGWGPRFLHSTGQFHKGGPQVGAFLQVTGVHERDLEIPGRDFSFGKLQHAQALGDRQALSSRGRPLLWLHLTDRRAGLAALLDAARGRPR